MNFGEPSRPVLTRVDETGRRVLPLWPDRWHVLFGDKQRPLWLPPGDYRLQQRCLRYFISNPYKALYARTLLRVNALIPRAGVLPELRLPRAMRSILSFELPVNGPWRAAIQIGTAGPYQKASVLLSTADGEGLAFAKVAMAQSADAKVAAEAGWLGQLAAMRRLAGQVPRLVAEGATRNGRRYLVTTVAPSTRQSSTLTSAHARFLAALGRERLDTLEFTASPCYRDLERTLAVLQPCTEPAARATLREALRACVRHLARWNGPFVIAQGDFAPWNIRVHRDRIFVFDWEYASAGANPLADIFNFLLMPRAVSGRPISIRVLAAAIREAAKRARQLYPEWNWRNPVIPALALAYLLEVILHYCLANQCVDHADPVVRSYWQLMERRSAWLAAT
jgi:hypothetical protein